MRLEPFTLTKTDAAKETCDYGARPASSFQPAAHWLDTEQLAYPMRLGGVKETWLSEQPSIATRLLTLPELRGSNITHHRARGHIRRSAIRPRGIDEKDDGGHEEPLLRSVRIRLR